MKNKIFSIIFLLSSIFVINDFCIAADQMQVLTLDIPAMSGTYMSNKIAKDRFSNQKYWNNATFNTTNSSKKYNLMVELRDTETNSSRYQSISNGKTYVFDKNWEKYAGMTYYVNLKSGTFTINKTYTTGIWYVSYN